MVFHVLLKNLLPPRTQSCTKETLPGRVPLAGDVVVDAGDDFSGEGEDALVSGLGAFAGVHGSDDAYQGAVAAVHLDGVFDEIVFGPIFAGHAAVMRPIPVEDQVAELSFGDDYAIGGKGI